MSYDIITIGSALLDIYIKSDQFQKVPISTYESGFGLCQEYGGKTEIHNLEVTTGGAGTNNAVSFAIKGFRTAIICELGTDIIGRMIKTELERVGVDLSLIIEEADEDTGLSSIMVSPDGGKAASIYRGASRMLTISDMRWDQMYASWFYISSLGGQLDLLEALINHASERQIKVALNPGNAEISALTNNQDQLHRILSKTTVLLINKQELEELQGFSVVDSLVWEPTSLVCKPSITVMTDGKSGGQVCTGGSCWKYQSSSTHTIEETGAGDAFGSGLVAALLKNQPIQEAVEWGKRQAANVVSHMGPKKGLLNLQDIESPHPFS